jgi:glycogen debranching enzyme
VKDADVTQGTIIKAGNAFCVAQPNGQLPAGAHPLGLFVDDCRHLSVHELRLNGVEPRLLVSSDHAGTAAVYELTNPELALRGGRVLPLQALRIRLVQRIHRDGLDETIRLRSHHSEPVTLDLTLRLDADFAPMLELREMTPAHVRTVRRQGGGGELQLSCVGLDGWTRATTVACEGATAGDDGLLRATVHLEPHGEHQLTVTCRFSATPPSEALPAAPQVNREPAARQAADDADAWLADRVRVETSDELVGRLLRRSLLDLRLLISDLDGQPYLAAGVPWYATLFGRDSLITAHQVLAFDPGLAAGTLRLLAAQQGRRDDPQHDEQPGRILHELRLGEVANTGRTPLARYYGTADATPLFLILLARHADWTGDLTLFLQLREHVDAALDWLDRYGDLDGDGLIEYLKRADGGLDSQGWKDSWDGICDEDGRPLTGPVALVEVHGYAIRAREEVARLVERLGEPGRAAQLRLAAARGREALDRFWLADLGAYAMALDGAKRPSRAMASNQGHLLWAGVVDPVRAEGVRDALMSPRLYSGWGIRTLAADEVAYNPVGYHTGPVWPHDTAIIAAGLRSYGYDDDFLALFEGLLDAAAAFPQYRLPELFAGFSREDYEAPVPYPVACRPQAWAAGSIPYLLTVALGLQPDALSRTLHIRRPLLPRHLDSLVLRDLPVADARVDLRFERVRSGERPVAVTDATVRGELDVVVDLSASRPAGGWSSRERAPRPSVVGEVGGQRAGGQHQEEDGAADAPVAGPDVRADRADEVQDEADGGGQAERRQGEPDQQPDRTGGQHGAQWEHPSVGDPDAVGGELDGLRADEVEGGGVGDREGGREGDCQVRDVHTAQTRSGAGT